jgi:hypothetical protein
VPATLQHHDRLCWGTSRLDGAISRRRKTDKVTLPAPIPAANFWSFTVYDDQTRLMLETQQKLAGPQGLLRLYGPLQSWFDKT